RHPDGRFEAARTDLTQYAEYIASKSFAGFKPVAHGGLITVVDLNIFQTGDVLGNDIQIIDNILRRDPRTEAVPGAPAGWRLWKVQTRVVGINPLAHSIEQRSAVAA